MVSTLITYASKTIKSLIVKISFGKNVENLDKLVNETVKFIKSSILNQKFNTHVFSTIIKKEIFRHLMTFALDREQYHKYEILFGTLMSFFKAFWKRASLTEEKLSGNADKIINLINKLPTCELYVDSNMIETAPGSQCWRFYALMKSVLSIREILMNDKQIPFIAFTLAIEYEPVIKKSIRKYILQVTKEKSFSMVWMIG